MMVKEAENLENQENLELFCNEWLNAWTGNKPKNLIDFYADDTYYRDPANSEGINGCEHLLNYFEKLLKRNPNWKWELIELFPTEKGFNFKWKSTIPIGTEQIIEYGMDIVELEPSNKRKIKRNEVYFDRTQFFSTLKKKM
ncbi:nuclear transport factor 2 family protein [Promethearchaeum syntrophicum]|uniref:Nuclear transport factor 2 family protein n=1 Tax=Promethearchaeum syntrophicum TaxID=2594042 RepID=A0A5B9DD69_9ARCH|nr:nuclear transport factor 2 family protein [Candidatus Prometheoarchaeum syntrophicum]QEE16981.1 SnoaL-like domain protein [Candidatus Prometheoarchaeum syntrophicum]